MAGNAQKLAEPISMHDSVVVVVDRATIKLRLLVTFSLGQAGSALF